MNRSNRAAFERDPQRIFRGSLRPEDRKVKAGSPQKMRPQSDKTDRNEERMLRKIAIALVAASILSGPVIGEANAAATVTNVTGTKMVRTKRVTHVTRVGHIRRVTVVRRGAGMKRVTIQNVRRVNHVKRVTVIRRGPSGMVKRVTIVRRNGPPVVIKRVTVIRHGHRINNARAFRTRT